MKFLINTLLCIFFLFNIAYSSLIHNGISKEFEPFNALKLNEICRIRIHNEEQGAITVSYDKGLKFSQIGKVLFPANKVNYKGYRASKWSNIGCVAATAVNAMHIKTDFNTIANRGIIFSLLPKQFKYLGKQKESSAIITDIKAGNKIFGEWISPFVGSPVFLIKENKIKQLPKGYIPSEGDVIEIQVLMPANLPKEIIFENRFGGRIFWVDKNDQSQIIGVVYSPVQGIGRFIGTQFVPPGRIRANHSGVIDISTSPIGKFGGFQIIPAGHSHSDEMWRARIKTQWMVIGPTGVNDPSIENIAPFFSSYIRPVYGRTDMDSKDWREKVQRRYLVKIKSRNKNWELMPRIDYSLKKPLPGIADKIFTDVTHIKIIFPYIKTPQEELLIPSEQLVKIN